jgi:predicted porin
VQYDLSKRTSLYSNIGQAGGDRADSVKGGDDFQFDIGVTHRF